MSEIEGDGPEDWSHLRYPQDTGSDMRWALFPFSLIRGVATWLLGADPVAARRQRRLAVDQRRSATELADAEKEAFRSLGERRPSD